eukprot:scaffold20887_cov22-Tisochrysis_lutea.AAC.2
MQMKKLLLHITVLLVAVSCMPKRAAFSARLIWGPSISTGAACALWLFRQPTLSAVSDGESAQLNANASLIFTECQHASFMEVTIKAAEHHVCLVHPRHSFDGEVLSFSLWDDAPQAVRLSRVPHTPLTPIIHLWDIDFCAVAASGPSLQGITAAAHTVSTTGAEVSRFGGEQVVRARGSSAAATASVPATQQGVLNSACLWFTLQLNDSTSITSAEVGMEQKGEGSQETKQGEVQQQQEQSSPSFWGQALLYLDLVLPVEPGQVG